MKKVRCPLWEKSNDGKSITRTWKFKNFKQVIFFINAVAWIAEQENHHPDGEFGYNTCQLTFTTHEADTLTEKDWLMAEKIDQLI